MQDPEPLNDFDGDASFDAFWNTYMSGARNGLEYEDNYTMRAGSSPLDPRRASSPQPISFLNTASLQQLIDSSHESAIAQGDSPGGAVHVGMNSVFMAPQILYLSAHS